MGSSRRKSIDSSSSSDSSDSKHGKVKKDKKDKKNKKEKEKGDTHDKGSLAFPSAHTSSATGDLPPTYSAPAPPPPSGYRIPLGSTSIFPPPDQAGPPSCVDVDGSPVYIGSALFDNSVHPCKVVPKLTTPCLVPYAGSELAHNGRYDLLLFNPAMMEWVKTTSGQVPHGRRPIEGGYEDHGGKLYHAMAWLNGLRVPGKCAEHLGGCNVPYGGREHVINHEYEILCWR